MKLVRAGAIVVGSVIAVSLGAGAAPMAAAKPAGKEADAPEKTAPEKTIRQVAQGKATLVVGDKGAAVTNVQKRLDAAGINTQVSGVFAKQTEKSVKHLQWKYLMRQTGRVDKSTYKQLTRITAGRMTLPKACRNSKTRVILCVDLKQKVVRYVQRGKVIKTIDIRTGRRGQETRKGNWRIYHKDTYVWSTLYNSPMPYSMFFSGGQAFHYSMYFASDGYYGASHGCVNIRSMSEAKWLYAKTGVGTPVHVY
ncbi:MAG: L,D-transpeptidase family protein [Candidatus Nanopelagicales bacterium]|nr:L,D-transpeptidase family protein [Candidatus Nanopelagicales bacterium]